ncbi:hypothetical protein ACJX0J_017796 [Zea mays]
MHLALKRINCFGFLSLMRKKVGYSSIMVELLDYETTQFSSNMDFIYAKVSAAAILQILVYGCLLTQVSSTIYVNLFMVCFFFLIVGVTYTLILYIGAQEASEVEMLILDDTFKPQMYFLVHNHSYSWTNIIMQILRQALAGESDREVVRLFASMINLKNVFFFFLFVRIYDSKAWRFLFTSQPLDSIIAILCCHAILSVYSAILLACYSIDLFRGT